MSITAKPSILELIFGKHVEQTPSSAEKFNRDHTKIGERTTKDKRGQVLARIPIYRYTGWEHGHRYTGKMLQAIRKINGVGRPPKRATQ